MLAESAYANPYLTLPVGEYELIYNILRHILQQLKAAGLKLTFVFDCLKVSKGDDQHKNWCRSELSDHLKKQVEMIDMLQNPKHNFQEPRYVAMLPWYGPLWERLIQEMSFECHTPHGQESDFYRAQLQRQRKAFAVLTNDTDSVLFPDCPVILWRMFDEETDLSYNLHLFLQ